MCQFMSALEVIEIQENQVSPKQESNITVDSQEALAVEAVDNSIENQVKTEIKSPSNPGSSNKLTGQDYYADLSKPSSNNDVVSKTDPVFITEIDKSKVDEVLQETKTTSTNDLNKEVDSLLKAAQKQLFIKKEITSSTQIVDAELLLREAEEEVAPSLKTKVYRVIESGFKKVKTAVAQRNNK